MDETDKRGKLEEEVFAYRMVKDGRVLLYWHDRHIKTLAGKDAEKFRASIAEADDFEAQLIMAKATGNFKHGNERRG